MVESKVKHLVIMFMILTCIISYGKEKEDILIIPFDSSKEEYQDYTKIITTYFEQEMLKLNYRIIDRGNLDKILEEQKLQLAGLMEKNVIKIGSLAGADKALIGKILNININKTNRKIVEIVLDVKIINVETSEIHKNISFREEQKFDFEIPDSLAINKTLESAAKSFYLEMKDIKSKYIFLNINYNTAQFKMDGMEAEDTNIHFNQDEFENISLIEMKIGYQHFKFGYFFNGGIFLNEPLKLYKAGLGIQRNIYENRYFRILSGTSVNGLLAYGEIAETIEKSNYGDSYSEGSKLKAMGFGYEILPFLNVEYYLNKDIAIYTGVNYSFLSKVESLDLEITDKLDEGQKKAISLTEFNPVIDGSGIQTKFGIQYNF